LYSEQKQALAAELSFKHPAVLAVSGSAGSGKTALLAALLPVLKSRGLKVGVIREADDLRLPKLLPTPGHRPPHPVSPEDFLHKTRYISRTSNPNPSGYPEPYLF